MKKILISVLLPVIVTGCATTDVSDNATGGYYEESGSQVVFESLDEVFDNSASADLPSVQSAVEGRAKILEDGGYSKIDIEALEEKGVDLSILEHSVVGFGFDSYKIDDASESLIAKHATLLTELPNLKVILEGHTDKRGDRAYNLKLGENRAIAVKEKLVSVHGIDGGRVEVISFGKENLLTNGDSEDDHMKNRRAEFRYQ